MSIESTKIETQLPNTQGKAEIRPMRLWAEYPGKLHLPAYKVQVSDQLSPMTFFLVHQFSSPSMEFRKQK